MKTFQLFSHELSAPCNFFFTRRQSELLFIDYRRLVQSKKGERKKGKPVRLKRTSELTSQWCPRQQGWLKWQNICKTMIFIWNFCYILNNAHLRQILPYELSWPLGYSWFISKTIGIRIIQITILWWKSTGTSHVIYIISGT